MLSVKQGLVNSDLYKLASVTSFVAATRLSNDRLLTTGFGDLRGEIYSPGEILLSPRPAPTRLTLDIFWITRPCQTWVLVRCHYPFCSRANTQQTLKPPPASVITAMACGKLEVQSCNLLWFLSTVYLVIIAQPKFAGVKRTTQTTFNLVVQRPRIAGGTLTIPLDSTVQLVNAVGKDREHNIIRLRYGSKAKHLVMRAASFHDRKQWLVALSTAMSQSQPNQKPTRSPHDAYAASTPPPSSFRRVVRQNIPSAMQFVITVGQIIASAH